MNEKTYLNVMHFLGDELRRAEFAEPYDPDEYNNVLEKMNTTNILWYRSQRKFSCWTRWIIFVLILLLVWVIYSIVF